MGLHDKRRPVVNNCEKATFLIEKKKFDTISSGEERMLEEHMGGCVECRRYERQSRLIDLIVHKLVPEAQPCREFDEAFGKQLQHKIDQRLRNGG